MKYSILAKKRGVRAQAFCASRVLFLLIAFLITQKNARSQCFKPSVQLNPSTTNRKSIVTGDFNNDGKIDFVSANNAGNTISLFKGDGTGNFAAPTQFNVGTSPYFVTKADLNSDGYQDIVVANSISNTISVLLNNGTGGFLNAVNYNTGNLPYSVAIGDFNNDGNLDAATANNNANSISIFLGNGTGTLGISSTVSISVPGTSQPSSIISSDFNKDGNLDLAVTMFTGNKVLVFLGDGSGSYLTPINTGYAVSARPISITAGDFNKDNLVDLAVANANSPYNISILLGTATSPFLGSASNYLAGTSPTSITSGDFNGDGNLDLACSNSGSASISVFIGSGTGTFGGQVNYATNTSAQPQGIASADFNGDGNLDIATANNAAVNSNKGISIFMNDPTPTMPSVSVTQPSCTLATGSISVVIQKPGHTYSFDNGATYQASNNISNLNAGTYDVIIKNSSGCLSPVNNATINPQPSIPATPQISATNENCTITVTMTQQNTNDLYSLDGTNFQSSNSFPNVTPATYPVTIKNTNGCQASINYVVSPLEGAPTTPVLTTQQPTCEIPNAQVTVTTQNATDIYSFDNGNSFQLSNVSPILDPGPYQLTVITKNKDGCTSPPNTIYIKDFVPDLNIAFGSATLCNNQLTSFNLTNPNEIQGTTFVWSTSNSNNISISESSSTPSQIADRLSLVSENISGSIDYQIRARSGNCFSAPQTVSLSVNPIPILTINSNNSICSGSSTTIAVTNSNQVANSFINWTTSTSSVLQGNGGVANLPNDNLTSYLIFQTLLVNDNHTDSITYTITPYFTNNGFTCSGAPTDVVIDVNPVPTLGVINNAPSVCTNSNANITLLNPNNVAGTMYEWSTTLNGVNINNPSSNTGPISDQLVLTNNTLLGSLTYTVKAIVGDCKSSPITTSVTVNPIPVITASSVNTLCSGNTTNIAIFNTNKVSGALCDWDINTTSVTGANPGSGVLNNDDDNPFKILQPLYVANTTGSITYTITPYFTNNGFTCSGIPTDVVIDVNPIPTLTVPDNIPSICDNSNTNIILSNPNSVIGTSYQWDINTSNVTAVNQSSSVGPIADKLVLLNPDLGGNITYAIKAVTQYCQSNLITRTIQVNPVPDIQVNNTTPTICNGDQVNILLSGASKNLPNVSYSWLWRNASSSILANEDNGITFTKINQAINLINDVSGSGILTYEITPSTSFCEGSKITTDVTINPNPKLAIAPSFNLCSNIPYTILGENVGFNYSWAILTNTNVTGINTTHNGTLLSENLSSTDGINTGTVIYQIRTISQDNCSSAPAYTVATVAPKPSFSLINNLQSICSGDRVNILFSTAIPGAQLLLSSVDYNGISGGSIEAGKSRFVDGQLLNQLLTNNTSKIDTVFYEFEPLYGTCTGQPLTTFVIVSPTPTMSIVNNTNSICSGSKTNITFASSNGSFSILEGVDYNGTTGGSLITNTAYVNGSFIKETLTNTTNTQLTVRYTFRVYNNSCSSPTLTYIDVTVQPAPTFSIENTSPSLCSGNPISITLKSNVSGILMQLKSIDYRSIGGNGGYVPTTVTSGSPTIFSNNSKLVEQLTNSNNSKDSVTYTFESVITGCAPSASKNAVVVVDLAPKFSISNSTNLICKTGKTLITVTPETANTTIKLKTVDYGGLTGSYTGNQVFPPGVVNISELLTNSGNGSQSVTYTFVANASGCVESGQQQTSLIVKPLPLVVFQGLPDQLSQNSPPVTLTGNQNGGVFSIAPNSSSISPLVSQLNDIAIFYPNKAVIASDNTVNITYSFNDQDNCTNSYKKTSVINPAIILDYTIDSQKSTNNNEFFICAGQGVLKLNGIPTLTSGQAPDTKFTCPADVLTYDGKDYYLLTDKNPGTYFITYTFKDAFAGVTSITKTVNLLAKPKAKLTFSNSCFGSPFVAKDASTLDTPFPAAINSWKWDFGETGLTSSLQNPTVTFKSVGSKNINLTISTDQGCSDQTSATVNIGSKPTLDFTTSYICSGESTTFAVTSKTDFGVVNSQTWNFGDNSPISVADNPIHVYNAPGTYKVQLLASTNYGCSVSLEKDISILPSIKLSENSFYREGFETSLHGWASEAFEAKNSTTSEYKVSGNSWLLTTPNGQTIKPFSNKSWWTGNKYTQNGFTYGKYENSAVNSPCFNLQDLKRPMVSFDAFVDMQNNVDGVVLQYSTDEKIWQNIGKNLQGINWYTGAGITANPGSQLIGNYGWSGNTARTWASTKFNLNEIPSLNRGNVRFRFAFATNDDNPKAELNSTYDGFAFDNFFIGEKTRNVLVEQFDNYTDPKSIDAHTYINQLFDNQLVQLGHTDFNPISYHINFPGIDSLNIANPQDPSARAGFYGITNPATNIMDGIIGATISASSNSLVNIDKESLTDSKFDLTLSAKKGSTSSKLTIDLIIKANSDYQNPLLIYIALVDNNINVLRKVVRKQLLGADGKLVNQTWVRNQTFSVTLNDIEINAPIYNPKNISLVAFVQDKITREVYQSTSITAPEITFKLITGLDDTAEESASLSLFPNPTYGTFNFHYPVGAKKWHLLNQLGMEIAQGDIDPTSSQPNTLNINRLSGGVYYFKLTIEGQSKSLIKKLVVLHN